MSLVEKLKERSGNLCELTGVAENLVAYEVPPTGSGTLENTILVAENIVDQLNGSEPLDGSFWQQHLPTSMWSEVPAVQITAWRLLNRLKQESWASEHLDMLYLDDEMLAWAKSGADVDEVTEEDKHRDANGAILENGDSVVLTKSLDVKGSSLNARIGTVVKNIRLVLENTEQIEGKIEGQQIVILTKFVRKHNG